jgi:hypothetical protein
VVVQCSELLSCVISATAAAAIGGMCTTQDHYVTLYQQEMAYVNKAATVLLSDALGGQVFQALSSRHCVWDARVH